MQLAMQIAATGAPIVLAIMGIYMSLRPPQPYGRGHWFWIGGFAVIGLLAATANFSELRSTDTFQTTITGKLDQMGQSLGIARGQSAQALADEIIKRLPNHQWPPLSRSEESALTDKLKTITPQPISIACATPDCKQLTEQFARAFTNAGWQPGAPHYGGGLGVDGIVGIRIASCDGAATKLQDAIETTTHLKIDTDLMKFPRCAGPIEFVVGEMPF